MNLLTQQQRKSADTFFDQRYRDFERLGREADEASKRGQVLKAKGIEKRIRKLQKEAEESVEFKSKNNRQLGRTYNDGKYY
jgi:hypothetical protein